MGKMERRKGHDFERAMVNRLKRICNPAFWVVRRGMQAHGGRDAPDVALSRVDNPGKPILSIECKRGKVVGLRAALEQAIDCNQVGSIPVVVAKDDLKEPVAYMRLSDFETFLLAWQDSEATGD